MDEFEQWQAYFYMRRNEREKTDWYLASIAQIIASSMGGSKAGIDKFLLNFEAPQTQKNVDASKTKWLSALGIKP